MNVDEMESLYVTKRHEYEDKIRKDLEKIEESVRDIADVGDYFSIKVEESLFTFKMISIDDEKHVAISINNSGEIPFSKLTLIEHSDLILWCIENKSFIRDGFREVLINAVRNGEQIINTLKAMNIDYE